MSDRTCSIADCDAPHYARDWCKRHYYRWKRNGTPTGPPPARGVRPNPIWRMVDKSAAGGCWLWLGQVSDGGYGRFTYGGRTWSAHRYTFELLVGIVPEGLELDHLCRVRACVNPDHLEPVTHQENMRRSLPATKEACAQGHLFTPDNIRFKPSRPTWRICRACERAREATRPKRHRPNRNRSKSRRSDST